MVQGRRAGLFFVFGVLVWMLSGCVKQDRTLVQIGKNDRILLSQFKKSLNDSFDTEYSQEMPDSIPFEKVQRLLDEMIDNRLIVLAAYEAGLDQDSTVQKKAADALINNMLSQLYTDKVINVAVTENDIRDYWVQSGLEVSCRKIEIYYPLKRDSAADAEQYQKAKDILAKARKGESFSRLARQNSDDRGTAPHGGEMLPLTYRANGDPVIEAAFSMKEGEISNLIETPKGWLILCVDKRDKKKKKSYEAAYDEIRNFLAQQRREKCYAITQEYLAELEKKANAAFHQDVLDTLANRVKRWNSSSNQEALDGLKALPEAEKAREIFSSRQQTIRVSDLIDVFIANPAVFYNGEFSESAAIKGFIDKKFQIQAKRLEHEARRLRYAKNPDVLDNTRRAGETVMTTLYYNKYIYAGFETDSNDVRKYYEDHLADQFTTTEKVRVQEVQVKTRQKADQVLDRLKRGENFGKIASEMTVRAGYNKKRGILPDMTRGSWGEIGEKAFGMKVGEIAVVNMGEDKYSVIKLLEIIPAKQKTFKEVASIAGRAFTKEKREQRKSDWMNAQREERGVFINEKVLNNLWKSYQKPNAKS